MMYLLRSVVGVVLVMGLVFLNATRVNAESFGYQIKQDESMLAINTEILGNEICLRIEDVLHDQLSRKAIFYSTRPDFYIQYTISTRSGLLDQDGLENGKYYLHLQLVGLNGEKIYWQKTGERRLSMGSKKFDKNLKKEIAELLTHLPEIEMAPAGKITTSDAQ